METSTVRPHETMIDNTGPYLDSSAAVEQNQAVECSLFGPNAELFNDEFSFVQWGQLNGKELTPGNPTHDHTTHGLPLDPELLDFNGDLGLDPVGLGAGQAVVSNMTARDQNAEADSSAHDLFGDSTASGTGTEGLGQLPTSSGLQTSTFGQQGVQADFPSSSSGLSLGLPTFTFNQQNSQEDSQNSSSGLSCPDPDELGNHHLSVSPDFSNDVHNGLYDTNSQPCQLDMGGRGMSTTDFKPNIPLPSANMGFATPHYATQGQQAAVSTTNPTSSYPWLSTTGAQTNRKEYHQSVNNHENEGDAVPHPKTAGEIKQIKRDLEKVAYPTTIHSLPGLALQYRRAGAGQFFDPGNPHDLSSFAHGEGEWMVEEPPAILGMLDPHPDFFHEQKMPVSDLVDASGRIVKHENGLVVRNFKALPRFLSSQLTELQVEAFMRIDPRIKYDDFRARQPRWLKTQGRNEINGLNNRRMRRVREPLKTRCWSGKYSDRPTINLLELLEPLTPEQIECNTTWVVTPEGIHPPNNPHWVLPKSEFKKPGHRMSAEVTKGFELLRKLQDKAAKLGVGHWKKLPAKEKPATWCMRQKNGRKRKAAAVEAEEDGDLLEEGRPARRVRTK